MDEVHVEVGTERLLDLGRLILAQQPVVNEDTHELISNRLVYQRGRHRGVDST